MLDKVINKHLDTMEDIEAAFSEDINNLIKDINVEKLIVNPKEEIDQVVDMIRNRLLNEYAHKAINLGKSLSKTIIRYDKEGKEINIDPSKQTDKNDGVLNARSEYQEKF